MAEGHTTLAVQNYLGELAGIEGSAPAAPIIRALIDRSVTRLHVLCKSLLLRSYPRLTRPPFNLQSEEMLSSVVDRLLRAMEKVRPEPCGNFLALANQHMRWELNDLARRFDGQPSEMEFQDAFVPAADTSASQLTPNALRMLQAIDSLPEEEGEVFSLVRIQGMAQTEVAELLGTSTKTIQRRLNRALMILARTLSDLNPSQASDDA